LRARHDSCTALTQARPNAHARTKEANVLLNVAHVPTEEQITDALGEVIVDLPARRSWKRQVGELRLMAAVLEDAVNVLRKRPRSRAGREAREWFASRDASWPFAYERICEALDLDPDRVRREVAMPAPVLRLPLMAPEAFRASA
jgi:hypothetical protein